MIITNLITALGMVFNVPLPPRPVAWTNISGLSSSNWGYVSDLYNDSGNAPYSSQFTLGSDFISCSASYYFDYGSNYGSDLVTRTFGNVDYSCGDNILLYALGYTSANSQPLLYQYENTNHTYLLYSYNYQASTVTYYAPMVIGAVYNRSTGIVTITSNKSALSYSVNFTVFDDDSPTTANSFNVSGILRCDSEVQTSNSVDITLSNFSLTTNGYPISVLTVTLFNDSQSVYYNAGWNDGYDSGYTAGNNTGVTTGYENGYAVGYNAGLDASNTSLSTLLLTVADTPIYFIRSLFNVELFGVKVYSVVLSLVTVMMVVWVIKKVV